MSRGHGAPGLLSNIRVFSDLIDDTSASRRPFLDFFPGLQIIGWTRHSGDVYKATVMQIHDGMLRDIVGVDTPAGPLVRVESIAAVTAGKFFTTISTAVVAPVHWDDGVTHWDDGVTLWDQYPEASYPPLELYVQLFGSADPRAVTVVALLGFYFGTRGEVHPTLGPTKLTAGDSDTSVWGTEQVSGAGFSSALDTVIFKSGIASTKLVSTGAATGNAMRREDIAMIAGARYAFAGYYRTDEAFSPNLTARILIGNTAATTFFYPDGRDFDANGQAVLTPTLGEWRAFWFDFIASATTLRVGIQITAPSSAGAGQLNLDRLSLKPIYRYVLYEPRIDQGSLPEVEVASQSIFFGGKTRGLGQVSLLNGDGVLERAFSQLILTNKPASTYVGGTFGDGQEIARDDWRGQSLGRVQRISADDSRIAFDTEDARNIADVQLPPRVVSRVEFQNASESDEGLPRWLIFNSDDYLGQFASWWYKAPRVDKAGDYGVYELADCVDSSPNLAGLQVTADPVVRSHSTEAAARLGQTPTPLLILGTDFTFDNFTGRITIIHDVRDYLRDRGGEDLSQEAAFDFDIGGGNLFGFAAGPSNARLIAAVVEQSMRNADLGAADIFVTYSHTTHKFTVSKSAGTLNLRMNTGPNADLRGWGILGFNRDADRTGALSYTGDDPTFTDVDRDHILRFWTRGYQDDGAGSLTGTPALPLDKHAWVAKYVLNRILGVPPSMTDLTSFQAGAAAETGKVRALIGEGIAASDVLRRCELGALADLVVDGDGIWRWRPAAAAAVVRSFFDRDYLSFTIVRAPENVYRGARVHYARNPAAGTDRVVDAVHDAGVQTKHGRAQVLDEQTYLWRGNTVGNFDYDAGALAGRLAKLAAANPRVVEFASRGKLVDLLIGDKIALTRSRAFDPLGSLSAQVFRVTALRSNHLDGVSRCTAVEDVVFT